MPGVSEYRGWQLVSTSPFVSATHGSMMINHIVNPLAAELYTRWEGMSGKRFAEGSILAKESYRITPSGELRVGPLFLMEKAAPGASPETDDWIYTRIFTNGRVQRTLGPDSDRMDVLPRLPRGQDRRTTTQCSSRQRSSAYRSSEIRRRLASH